MAAFFTAGHQKVESNLMRILLVEDEPAAARFIAKGLREAHHAVDVARDGTAAAERVQQNDYDAVILDIMLPGKDGLTLCREMRAAGSDVPVLMLTARDAVEARVQGLDAGADDYLTKPFDFRALLARVRALTRRDRRPLAPERIEIRHIAIDLPAQRVWSHGHELILTSREYALLEYLARRVGDVVSRSDIAEHVWDEHYDAFSNVVDVYVQRLRRKLDEPTGPSLIRTRRGQGYQLI
jgi:two-component system, OmpR family, copper resistance phosphate regulon response regulator CusR